MHTIMSPIGTTASIPAVLEEDQAYFTLKDLAEASTYYAENGYVVVRNLVDKALCRKTIELFDRHVGQFPGTSIGRRPASRRRTWSTSRGS